MSLLIANVVPEGLIFAADRNLSDPTGRNVAVAAKVMKERGLLIGYVGLATVGDQPMHEWLRAFVATQPSADVGAVAYALADELERNSAGLRPVDRGTIVHVGGFEDGPDGRPLPVIWYVRDKEIQRDGSYRFLGRFEARDELKEFNNGQPPYFGDICGDKIRQRLRDGHPTIPWAGFRQSFDITVFGALDRNIWRFAGALVDGIARETTHKPPRTLDEWAQFMKFSVLCYAAYFEAFYPPGKHIVGGGVDIVSLPWPE